MQIRKIPVITEGEKAYLIKVGDELRRKREMRNISRSYLSSKTDIDEITIARIERGEANLSLKYLYRLETALSEIEFKIILSSSRTKKSRNEKDEENPACEVYKLLKSFREFITSDRSTEFKSNWKISFPKSSSVLKRMNYILRDLEGWERTPLANVLLVHNLVNERRYEEFHFRNAQVESETKVFVHSIVGLCETIMRDKNFQLKLNEELMPYNVSSCRIIRRLLECEIIESPRLFGRVLPSNKKPRKSRAKFSETKKELLDRVRPVTISMTPDEYFAKASDVPFPSFRTQEEMRSLTGISALKAAACVLELFKQGKIVRWKQGYHVV